MKTLILFSTLMLSVSSFAATGKLCGKVVAPYGCDADVCILEMEIAGGGRLQVHTNQLSEEGPDLLEASEKHDKVCVTGHITPYLIVLESWSLN